MGDQADDELVARVSALEETLDELREEFTPRPGPFGLPRPPTPREVLRFTDEYAIPAAIAILQANLRTLELLQAILRGARGAPREDEIRGRATALGRTTVERVDRALADLQTAMEDGDLPRNAEARSLLEEARSLNEEVRDAFASSDSPGRVVGDTEPDATSAGRSPDDRDEGAPDGAGEQIEIDVDAELESIKDEMGEAETQDGGIDETGDPSDKDDDGDAENRTDRD